MSTWHIADGKFSFRYKEVKQLCEQHFGPEHKQNYNAITKRKQDNHGNWHLTFGGKLHFRYKKDLSWFLLMGANLADPQGKWPWANPP